MLLSLLITLSAFAADTAAPAAPAAVAPSGAPEKKLRYKKGAQSHKFDDLTVKGQVYRPDLSVVTSDLELGSLGAIRLRNDFKDQSKASLLEDTQ